MPFRLTSAQLRMFNGSHDERMMARYVRAYKEERVNPALKRRYYNEALHYFIQLPLETKHYIERLEHANKHKRGHH